MKYYLTGNTYDDRAEIKTAGGRYDPAEKKWYFTRAEDKDKFRKWLKKDEYDLIHPVIKKNDTKSSIPTKQDAAYVNPYEGDPGLFVLKYSKLDVEDDFVILDTETTGLREDDEVIEVAVIDRLGTEIFHSMFHPEQYIQEGASKVTGIYNKDLESEPYFKDCYQQLLEAIGNRKIVAYNTDYDRRLLIQTAARYGIDVSLFEKAFEGSYDAMDFARKYLNSSSYSLLNVCSMLGITKSQTHRASYDCLMVLEMMIALETRTFISRPEAEEKLKNDANRHRKSNIAEKRCEAVYEAYRSGKTVKEISSYLKLSVETVKKYCRILVSKKKIPLSALLDDATYQIIVDEAAKIPLWDGRKKSLKIALENSGNDIITYSDIEDAFVGDKLSRMINQAKERTRLLA